MVQRKVSRLDPDLKSVLSIARIRVHVSAEIPTIDGYLDDDEADIAWSRVIQTTAYVSGNEIIGMSSSDAARFVTEGARPHVEKMIEEGYYGSQ